MARPFRWHYKRHNKPLVYTVHDLRNPHHTESDAHAAQQEELIAAAKPESVDRLVR